MQSRFLAVLLAVLSVACLGSAQTSAHNDRLGAFSERALPSGAEADAPYTVSVRELRIPEKAHRSFDKGAHLLQEGNAEASIVEFKRAIAAFHSYYEAYYQLGAAQIALGQDQAAKESFSQAIQLSDGRFARPYFALSLMLCHDKNFSEGDTLAKMGLSLSPDSLLGQFSLSWSELGLGRSAVAEETLRKVLQRKPDFREARLLLAEIHRRENNLSELVADIDAYLKLDGASPASTRLRALRDTAVRLMAPPENKEPAAASVQR